MVSFYGEDILMRKRLTCQWLVIGAIFICLQYSPSLAFSPQSLVLKKNDCFRKGVNSITTSKIFHRKFKSISLHSTEVTSQNEREVAKLLDRNDNEFQVGCIVRVNSSTKKAFHVSKKAYGYFNEEKEFIPCVDATERTDRCLLVPEGLRGTVTRIYDINDLSTNFPILVKFVKGENVEEGYSSPQTFTMHFDTTEVDVVTL